MAKRGPASPKEKARLKALRKKHGLGEFAPNRQKGAKKSKSPGVRVAKAAGRAANVSSPKKMTVGKALDMGSVGAAGIYEAANFYSHRDSQTSLDNISAFYTGFVPSRGTFEPVHMVKGYGPMVNRALEKKAYKVLGVKGPRSKIKTMGDVLDHVTYWGSTAAHLYDNRTDPALAARVGIKIQYGVDMGANGFSAYEPMTMVKNKMVPYLAQKYARKLLRRANISFGGIL